MKKILTLKLIETTDFLPIGGLYQEKSGKYYISTIENQGYANDKRIKPILISDEEIKVGDIILLPSGIISKMSETDMLHYINSNSNATKKIEVTSKQLPQHILEAIVEGKLKDGDSVEVYYHTIGVDLTISKPIVLLDSNSKAICTFEESIEKKAYKAGAKFTKELEEKYDYNKFPMNPNSALPNWMNGESTKEVSKMYSEEEVAKLTKEAYLDGVRSTGEGWNGEYADGNGPDVDELFGDDATEWFNQNKKKQSN